MVDQTLKKGDTSPALAIRCTDENDKAINLSNFNEITFYLTNFETGDRKIKSTESGGDVVVINASEGKVKYEWQPLDTDEVGMFEGEFEVEYSDGTTETFPNQRDLIVKINPNNE